jgi:hypothetical protein
LKKIIIFIIIFVFSCTKPDEPRISFYYWKTIFKLSTSEKTILSDNKVTKLYLRYFDITLDKNNQPFPESPIRFEQKPTNFEIIPVIYIKNQVFLNKNLDISDLASKTYSFINQINTQNQIVVKEIQIDCDWTLNSKDNYLKFIEIFKEKSNKKLSATIRLHQIKYFRQTKIPSVDKGVLMYYNMGKIAPDSLNSIYDHKIANRYLESLKNYPLELNIALPIYSWAIHIRYNKVIGLKNKIDVKAIQKDTNFVVSKNNFYKVKNNNFKSGTFYKKNDLLKFESISGNDLLEMASNLESNLKQNPKEIIFYDLDHFNFKSYEKNIFTQVSSRF